MLAALLIRTLRWMHYLEAEADLHHQIMYSHESINDYCDCRSSLIKTMLAFEEVCGFAPYKEWPLRFERQGELGLIFLPANAKRRKDN